MDNAKLGNALFNGLNKLRQQTGNLDMADVGALFEQISSNFHVTDEHSIQNEIGKLALFLKQAKNEFSAIGNHGNGNKATGDATLHLDAVIKGTEEASHAIMDAADAIQKATAKLSSEPQKIINDAITKIYEACNFQDLTGQRVGKVIKILNEIDARIHNMLKLSGAPAGSDNPQIKKILSEEEKLLNGPQLPNQAPSQADIDALFGKL